MPLSTPARPRPPTSKACSSTVHRACVPSPSCRLHARPAIQPTERRYPMLKENAYPISDRPHGAAVLNDPVLNKGSAFTPEERKRLGIEGLLPPATDSLGRQVERVLGHLDVKPNDLERYVY